MNILAIDSSTELLSVCLSTGEGRRAEALLDTGLTHAERVMELVDFCVRGAGLAPSDLELLACAEGPGSFTGLRIGMATIKGLSLALGIPWVAAPTLDILAWGLDFLPGAVVPVIDGRKGRLYAAIYHRGLRSGPWLDLPLAALIGLLDTYTEVTVTGPDASLLEALATERSGFRLDPRARSGTARGLCALAEGIFAERGGFPDDAVPLYLRPSEAEETAERAGAVAMRTTEDSGHSKGPEQGRASRATGQERGPKP